MAADTGLAPKALWRMSVQRDYPPLLNAIALLFQNNIKPFV